MDTQPRVHTKCERCGGNIMRGEAYYIAPIVYRPNCGACASEVYGSDWYTKKYADIGRNGYQVPWSERKDG